MAGPLTYRVKRLPTRSRALPTSTRRAVIGPADRGSARRVIIELLTGRTVLQGPPIATNVMPTTALVRTGSHMASQASLLTLQAKRPTTGFRFPLSVPPDLPDPPAQWPLPPSPFFSAPLWMLGLPIAPSALSAAPHDPNAHPLPGLYIGALERRAWIVKGRRLREDPSLYLIELGLDEGRIDRADLVLDLEEYVDDTLAVARRLPLADLALPDDPSTPSEVLRLDVRVPTLGSGVARQIRLYDRDGLLLDATDRSWTVEQINLTVDVGGYQIRSTVGSAQVPDLTERLQATDLAQDRFRALMEGGLPDRVIESPSLALARLRAVLARARGELLVLDPYFGWHLGDWTVLDDVTVGVRVLSGHGYYDRTSAALRSQKALTPPRGTAGSAPSLEVRTWRAGSAPWHDRLYLWEGGGLSVGTSPSGLGGRLARIDRIGEVEADAWRSHFEIWWRDPLAQPL
jgi:hypothetical protein